MSATPLLLEYGGPRPVFTVPPWRRATFHPVDPCPLIEPVNARASAFVDVYRANPNREGWDAYIPAAFRHAPFVEVCTAPVRAWKAGRNDQFTSRFFVRGRFSFGAAYRAARMIAAGRPVRTAMNWEMWQIGMYADIAPAHRRLVSLELAEAFENRLDRRTGCRVCGCTDEAACSGGCHWDQPDLCSACVGREKHGPCGGFAGECDWCGKRSRRLQLSGGTTEFGWRMEMAECPRCRKADGKEGY